MTLAKKLKTEIKKLSGFDYEDIVCLGGETGTWIYKDEISMAKMVELLRAGYIALPF